MKRCFHFPTCGYYEGMTIRDYFAAKAMASIISMNNAKVNETEQLNIPNHSGIVAELAYNVADAMLEARKL